jgi:flagellar hook-length control protein FliK
LELPFFHEQRPDSVRIEIEQDKHPANPDSAEKNWAVSITLTPPNLATIHCKISYYDGAVHTRFWSQAPATVNSINRHIDTLRQQFEQKGLTPGFMEAHTGKPTKTETSPTPLPRLFNAHA